MSSRPEGTLEAVIRQILRLVDLGCDLERNLSDSEFAASLGHEVIPVFDENIFEMFVTPQRFREASETFYADLWDLTGKTTEQWRGYETQTALLTSELLLSRKVEGATTDAIFMTEFHRWELADRLEHIQGGLEELRERNPKDYQIELDRKLQVLARLIAPSQDSHANKSAENDTDLTRDLEHLRDRLPPDAVERIVAARRATAVLAKSQLAEPLDQVIRIGSPEILDRITLLQQKYRPTAKELDEIDYEAESWFIRLRDELITPGHRKRLRARNEQGKAMWNDARALSYLRWVVNTKLKPNQRLVFITGDLVLFDAYRRWYFTTRTTEKRPSEPFFLRRVTQYTPLFNPVSSGSDLFGQSEGTSLFGLIQRVVDACLLALPENLSPLRSNIADSITDERSEILALKQVDYQKLSDDPELALLAQSISDHWGAEAVHIIANNRELWQEVERLSIGAAFDLVCARISDHQRDIAIKYSSAIGENSRQILADYASTVLDRLLTNNLNIWLPMAEILLDPQFKDPYWRRPPIKRISMGLDPIVFEGGDEASQRKPYTVFALGALKALELQDIANAVRFSGHALRAAELREGRESEAPKLELELKYLSAVTYRLSVATVDAHLKSRQMRKALSRISGPRAIDQIKTMYGRASALIHECIAVHYHRMKTSDYDRIRYFRALSERASLHLFVATSFALSADHYQLYVSDDAREFLDLARGDLQRCIDFDEENKFSGAIAEAVRAQYVPNIAGYETLAFLMSGENEYQTYQWKRSAKAAVKLFWKDEKNAHALLAAELAAYGLLTDTAHPKGRKYNSNTVKENLSQLRLPLDRELYKEIHRQLFAHYGPSA